jgi:hypothetical protein
MDMEKRKEIEISRRRVVSGPGIDEILLNLAVDRMMAEQTLTDGDAALHAGSIESIGAESLDAFMGMMRRYRRTFGEAPGLAGRPTIEP